MNEQLFKQNISFSIIVPVYNTAKYLPKCIESIIGQTCKSFEIILVDDGSTDGSGEICEEYAKKYDFISVIHQKKNGGVSAARNAGLDVAQYDWISFIDSDDWIEDKTIEALSEYIADNGTDLYSYNINRVTEDGILDKVDIFSADNQIIEFDDEKSIFEYYYNTFLIGAAGNTVWERVFKREIIQKYNIRFISRDTVYAEDIMFILQYMMYVKKISVLSDVFYNYRVRNGSLTDNIDKSSALLCLNTLAVTGYKDAESLNMNYFCEEYYKLYFALFDNQISYLFGGQSVITTHRMLKKLNVNFLHRKWSKQIKLMILKDKKLFWSLLRKHIRRRIITLGLK